MPPKLNVLSFSRSIPYRPKPQSQWRGQPVVRVAPQGRFYSDTKDAPPGPADRSHRIDAEPIAHVSEEAAVMAEIRGEEGPDMTRGTPVEEVR
jgi:small subunit ribosomal protein S7